MESFESFSFSSGDALAESSLGFDQALRRLNHECLMPAESLQLEYLTEPSFLKALRFSGEHHQVVFMKTGSGEPIRLGALGIRSARKARFNGSPVLTAYFHHLRIHPSLRGGTSLARGYRAFHGEAEKLPAEVSFTSILRENKAAVEILENSGGRGPLPRYIPFCDYLTVMIPLKGFGKFPSRGRLNEDRAGKYEVRTIDKNDAKEFLRLQGEFGERHSGSVFLEEGREFGDSGELLPGLRISDFIGVFHGGRLVAAVGLWDQTEFKQVRLAGLGNNPDWLWKGVQLLSPFIGASGLPSIGENIPYIYFDPWFVAPGHENAVRPLLAHACRKLKNSRNWFAVWGVPESHPAAFNRKYFFHLIYRSIIYRVAWDGDSCPELKAGQIPFANLGFL